MFVAGAVSMTRACGSEGSDFERGWFRVLGLEFRVLDLFIALREREGLFAREPRVGRGRVVRRPHLVRANGLQGYLARKKTHPILQVLEVL